jgi:PPOX class probable F420-dependent enzyme
MAGMRPLHASTGRQKRRAHPGEDDVRVGRVFAMREMSANEARAFLADGVRTAKLATTRADGAPDVVPVWFVLDGDEVVFTCSSSSVKARNLARDPRAALVVDDEAFPHAFVRVRGTVEMAVRPDDFRSWTTRIAARYVGAGRAEEYGRRNEEFDDCLVRLMPDSILARADVAL